MSQKPSVEYGISEDVPDDTALMRRVDWRILPVMFLTYFLQFLDKVSLNVLIARMPVIETRD